MDNKIIQLTDLLKNLKGEIVILEQKSEPQGKTFTQQVIIGNCTNERFQYYVASNNAFVELNNWVGNIVRLLKSDSLLYEDEEQLVDSSDVKR